MPRCHRGSQRTCRHPAPQERQTMEDRHRWRGRPKPGPASIKIPWSCPVAAMEPLPPPKPRRNDDALCQTAEPAARCAGLRPTVRRDPGPHLRPKRLHRAWHTRHGSCGISPSGQREPRRSADLNNRAAILEKVTALQIYRDISRRIYKRNADALPDLPSDPRAADTAFANLLGGLEARRPRLEADRDRLAVLERDHQRLIHKVKAAQAQMTAQRPTRPQP